MKLAFGLLILFLWIGGIDLNRQGVKYVKEVDETLGSSGDQVEDIVQRYEDSLNNVTRLVSSEKLKESPSKSIYRKSCKDSFDCVNPKDHTGTGMECNADLICDCVTYKGIQLIWSEPRVTCLGAKGTPCITPAMCYYNKCIKDPASKLFTDNLCDQSCKMGNDKYATLTVVALILISYFVLQ